MTTHDRGHHSVARNARHIDDPLKQNDPERYDGSAMWKSTRRISSFMRSRRSDASGHGWVQYTSAFPFMGDIDYALMNATTVTSASGSLRPDRFFEKHHRVTRLYVPLQEYEHTAGT